jgi:hypothetical protein
MCVFEGDEAHTSLAPSLLDGFEVTNEFHRFIHKKAAAPKVRGAQM